MEDKGVAFEEAVKELELIVDKLEKVNWLLMNL